MHACALRQACATTYPTENSSGSRRMPLTVNIPAGRTLAGTGEHERQRRSTCPARHCRGTAVALHLQWMSAWPQHGLSVASKWSSNLHAADTARLLGPPHHHNTLLKTRPTAGGRSGGRRRSSRAPGVLPHPSRTPSASARGAAPRPRSRPAAPFRRAYIATWRPASSFRSLASGARSRPRRRSFPRCPHWRRPLARSAHRRGRHSAGPPPASVSPVSRRPRSTPSSPPG
mmetsp:Transcript_96019/g.266737  ORF Transcript_96019/g.266737 Transcript_96019/m.266737 type:complete len:230 (+) Transcript_96019:57-746(+)